MAFSLSEEQIIAVCQKNEDVFAEFYHHSFDVFFRYIKWKSGFSDSRIDDILGDVYVKIWEGLEESIHTSFSGFVWTVLKNTLYDVFKKKSESSFGDMYVEDGPDFADSLISDDDVHAFSQQAFQIEHITHALSFLPSDDADIVYRRLAESLSYEDIALRLSMNPDAVRQRYKRIIGRLQQTLSQYSSS